MIDLREVKEMYVGGKPVKYVYIGNKLVRDFTLMEEPPAEPEPPVEPIEPPVEPIPDPEPQLPNLSVKFPFQKGITLKDNWKDRSAAYIGAVLDDYNRIGAENAFKMQHVMKTENVWTWDKCDEILNWARLKGKKVFVHCIIWANVLPAWLKDKKGVWTEAQWKSWLQWYVTEYINHLRPWFDVIEGFDVLNECFGATRLRTDTNPKKSDGNENTYYSFLGAVFPDFPAAVFEAYNLANTGKPGFINDFSIETSDAKPTTIVNYIKGLAQRGIIVDGIGSQTHSPADVRFFQKSNVGSLETRFRKITSAGLLFHISELDVKLRKGVSTSNGWPTNIAGWTTSDKTKTIETTILKGRPDLEQLHADWYVNLFKVYMKVTPPAQRFGITEWGVGDRDTHLNYPDYTDFPTIRYYDYTPKPTRQALMDMPLQAYVP